MGICKDLGKCATQKSWGRKYNTLPQRVTRDLESTGKSWNLMSASDLKQLQVWAEAVQTKHFSWDTEQVLCGYAA